MIAVEIHQVGVTSSDISFDLELQTREVDTPGVPGTPFAELDDYYTLTADKIHFSANQSVAVRSIELSVDVQNGRAETRLGFQILPSMGRIWWRNRFQIPGVGAIVRDKIPTTPVATLDVFDHGINVTWDTPIISVVHYYEVHQSVTGGFTPSASTLIQRTQANRYRSNESGSGTGMDQLTEYFFKIVAVDKWGNKSAVSAQVSSIPGYLRGFAGRLETTIPSAELFLQGQSVQVGDVVFKRREQTLQELIISIGGGPYYYLRMDGDSTALAFLDASGNGNDFSTLGTAPNVGIAPLVNDHSPVSGGAAALEFLLAGDHAIQFDGANASVTELSYQCWIKAVATANAQGVCNAFDNGGSSRFVMLFQSGFNGALQVNFNGAGFVSTKLFKDDFMKQGAATPHHIAFVWDDASGNGSIYRNGLFEENLVVGATGTGGVDFEDWVIGAINLAGTTQIDGIIDSASAWLGHRLTSAEVQEIYRKGQENGSDWQPVSSDALDAWKAYIGTDSVAATHSSTGNFQVMPVNNLAWDIGGNFDLANLRWVAPYDCIVHVNGQWNFNNVGTFRQTGQFYVNGLSSDIGSAGGIDTEGGNRSLPHGGADIKLAEGDLLNFNIFQQSGGNLTYTTLGLQGLTNFWTGHVVRRLGP